MKCQAKKVIKYLRDVKECIRDELRIRCEMDNSSKRLKGGLMIYATRDFLDYWEGMSRSGESKRYMQFISNEDRSSSVQSILSRTRMTQACPFYPLPLAQKIDHLKAAYLKAFQVSGNVFLPKENIKTRLCYLSQN